MIFYVDPLTLHDPSERFAMRSSAIYALKRLSILGHGIYTPVQLLSDRQCLLIYQEGIDIPNHKPVAPDYIIEDDRGTLLLNSSDKVIAESFDDWESLMSFLEFPPKTAVVKRKTKETDIRIGLNLFGSGRSEISTGIGFFDHMLDQIAKHALLDLELTCIGDLEIDEHHTIEDVGIALGEALNKALENKKGLERFGFLLPMDEAESKIALDLSGRPFLVFEGDFAREYVGRFPTEMVKHFFYSLAMSLQATLHIEVKGDNDHHKVEACFKGFARALRQALLRYERTQHVIPSSKGVL